MRLAYALVRVRKEAGDPRHVGRHERDADAGQRDPDEPRDAATVEHREAGELAGLEQEPHGADDDLRAGDQLHHAERCHAAAEGRERVRSPG